MGQGGRRRGGYRPEITERERRVDRPRWRDLAERARRAAEAVAGDPELAALGSQARDWRWPAPLPEGALVCALAGTAHAYGRQTHPHVRAALAPSLKVAAEIVLELLDAVGRGAAPAPEPTPSAEAPAWTRRADIGGGDDGDQP